MKKIFSIISAILLTISMTFVFTACDSNRPKITIVLEDGREMTFILYRDYAPITVEHFLELCSSGYYDNTAISDIASSHILAGNYEFNVDFTDLNLKNVVDSIRGEFTANGVTVENNPLLHEFGTLSLFNDWAGGVENGSKNSGSNFL
jgi:cyclophilin family peptidyl-prolyl cis-trans isomerase